MGGELDPDALAAVRDFYDDLQVDGRVLDLGGASAEHFNVPPDALIAHEVAETLPYEDGEFDDVVYFSANEEALPAFAEIARVLRPNGRFIYTFAGHGDDSKRVRLAREEFKRTRAFGPAESDLRSSLSGEGDRLWAVWAPRRP
jgi:SAM-dependent methyltransferase